MIKKYDVIGDIHANAHELKMLLKKLGYTKNELGIFTPCELNRKAVFTGDFVDRGHENFEVIDIVKGMINAGYAHAVMGNHDLNAGLYHTRYNHDDHYPQYLRPHTQKNAKQHATFIDELNRNNDVGLSNIEWLKSLPLWLEMDGIRFVHAQWHEPSMSALHLLGLLNHDNSIKADKWGELIEGKPGYDAVSLITKGTEVDLNGATFLDADGNRRGKTRLKWWGDMSRISTLEQVVLDVPRGVVDGQAIPPGTIDLIRSLQNSDGKIIFFGHYRMKGPLPTIETRNAICIDQSVAHDGYLAAATVSTNGDKIFNVDFTSVKSRPNFKPMSKNTHILVPA